MNILMAFIHYPISSGRYMARALRRLGHQVVTVGPSTGPYVWRMRLTDESIHVPDVLIHDVPLPGTFPVSAVLDALEEWTPDLILTCDSAFSLSGAASMPHVLYGVDNHVRPYSDLGVKWDHRFHAHAGVSIVPESEFHWLPCGYDPEWHQYLRPWYERPAHAALIGVLYPERQALLQAVGAKYAVVAGTGPIMEAYRDLYNQAVVSLCLSSNGDVGQRIFESAAMGNVILTDPCPDLGKLGLIEGTHYLSYRTPAEAVAQMDELLNGPGERIDAMVMAVRAWALTQTWDVRAQTILATVFGDGGEQ